MNPHLAWHAERLVEAAARALERSGFTVRVCPDRAGAVEAVLEEARGARTVGFGGSATLVELGLPDRLEKEGKECLVHGRPGLSPEQRLEIMRRQLTCDLFLSGANAITLDGKVVNVDATGNRVGALAFGPGKVRIVAGANKIVADLQEALARIKLRVAPPNARRLGLKTPKLGEPPRYIEQAERHYANDIRRKTTSRDFEAVKWLLSVGHKIETVDDAVMAYEKAIALSVKAEIHRITKIAKETPAGYDIREVLGEPHMRRCRCSGFWKATDMTCGGAKPHRVELEFIKTSQHHFLQPDVRLVRKR